MCRAVAAFPLFWTHPYSSTISADPIAGFGGVTNEMAVSASSNMRMDLNLLISTMGPVPVFLEP